MTIETTTLLLIRHGQTNWNKEGRWQGHMDVPLNEAGREQAQKLARRLSKWPIDVFLSSDLKRAFETAVITANPHNLDPIPDPIWRERHIGDFQGKTKEQVKAHFPAQWKEGILEPPNGETFAQMQKRASSALAFVQENYAGKMVAAVSHGQLIHVLLAQVMGIAEGVYGRFTLRGNSSLSIVEISNSGTIVSRLNDTAHLEK